MISLAWRKPDEAKTELIQGRNGKTCIIIFGHHLMTTMMTNLFDHNCHRRSDDGDDMKLASNWPGIT